MTGVTVETSRNNISIKKRNNHNDNFIIVLSLWEVRKLVRNHS